MKNSEYESVEHIDTDLSLMFENAKRYNVPHSTIYKRALKLQHIQQVSRGSRQLKSGKKGGKQLSCTVLREFNICVCVDLSFS